MYLLLEQVWLKIRVVLHLCNKITISAAQIPYGTAALENQNK